MKIDHKESYTDFGEQFAIDKNIDDYWGSKEMLVDIVKPFNLELIKDKIIMEVGSGSGRILKNLLKFHPNKVICIEPSKAIKIAKENNKDATNIKFENIKGENLNINNELDYVFSLGMIHHTPNAELVVKKIFQSLKTNGKFICWVYGYEGNRIYVLLFNNLRKLTTHFPDFILRILSHALNLICFIYIFLCKFMNLPMKNYMLNVFNKCSYEKRNYIIFDQLNPSFAKYYKKKEIEELIKNSGFSKSEIFHRRGYSWTIIATKN